MKTKKTLIDEISGYVLFHLIITSARRLKTSLSMLMISKQQDRIFDALPVFLLHRVDVLVQLYRLPTKLEHEL